MSLLRGKARFSVMVLIGSTSRNRLSAGAVAVVVLITVPAVSLRVETMEWRWLIWSRRQQLSGRRASRRPGEVQGCTSPSHTNGISTSDSHAKDGTVKYVSSFALFVAQGPDSGHLFYLRVATSWKKTTMPNEQTTSSYTVSAYSDPSHSDFYPLPRTQSQKFVLQEPNPRVHRIRAVSPLPQRT